MGDFNIDLQNIASDGFLYLNNLCETYSLKNLIKNKLVLVAQRLHQLTQF